MAWRFTLEEIQEYKVAFKLFDINENGVLEEKELENCMRSLGQNFSNTELKEILLFQNKVGLNFEFHEFLDLMAKHRQEEKDKTSIIKSFKYFDRDNTGYIYYEEFKHAITSIAEKLSTEEINKLEEEISYDSDGKFQYKELVKKISFK